jgi:hypothetical protein
MLFLAKMNSCGATCILSSFIDKSGSYYCRSIYNCVCNTLQKKVHQVEMLCVHACHPSASGI